MKRIWAWLSERLFVSESDATAARALVSIETPAAPWSLSDVQELRWA
jgi:hypothetical protein